MKAIIKKRELIARDTILVSLDLLGETISFKPGQYLKLVLLNPPYSDSKGNSRIFSISSSPVQNNILEITTRLSGSAFKKSLNEMPLGTPVEITNINGVFILPQNSHAPIVMIAGGIGITPFRSMLKFYSENHLDLKIFLLYSNRDRESAAFIDELRQIEKDNTGFKLILTMTDDPVWSGENRRIDSRFIKDYIKEWRSSLYFVVGSPAMVKAVYEELLTLGVKPENIKYEEFIGY